MGTDGVWCSILQRPLFSRAAGETSATLAHLSAIFVERHHLVWKVKTPWPATVCPGQQSCRSSAVLQWQKSTRRKGECWSACCWKQRCVDKIAQGQNAGH